MTQDERKLREIELHVAYVCKLAQDLSKSINDRLTEAEKIRAKKVLGLKLTTEEKTYLKIMERLQR